MEILKGSVHRMNKCVVVVTHSEALAKEADIVLWISQGYNPLGYIIWHY